jgi:hypothetical protein
MSCMFFGVIFSSESQGGRSQAGEHGGRDHEARLGDQVLVHFMSLRLGRKVSGQIFIL